MWFPYSLPTSWKVEGERECANDSFADDQSREFLIGVQLRNPVAREWSVELQLKEPKTVVENDITGEPVQISFFPDENERLAEIVCKMKDTNTKKAVRRCYALVSDILDYWSAEYGRGFSIGGLRIADMKHNARWRVVPHWPSALSFTLPALSEIPQSLLSLARLYREGRTSTSDRYRFLCCESVLARWNRRDPPFDWLSEEDNVQPLNEELYVNEELMVISGMIGFSPELEGTSFSELPERLKDWHLDAVRFALEGRDEIDEKEDLNRIFEWSAVANLVDLAAHKVLSRTIEQLHQSGDTTNEFPAGNSSTARSV